MGLGDFPSDRGETESVDPGDVDDSPPVALPAGTLVAGRYRLAAVLGHGGYAVVYRARDEATGSGVALKILRTDRVTAVAARRLQREAESAAAVRHPGLVSVSGHGTSEHGPYLAMELVEGETLRERIARGPLPVTEATRLAMGIAEALAALHDLGLVHRDLKPSNVLLGPDGAPRLADLGLVTALDPGDETRATRADGLVGTMEYLSPEQALGRAVDARSDLYSLGVVLFEMLAGQLPFVAQSSLGTVLARVTEAPTPLTDSRPDAPAWLVGVVHKLLAREPDQRYGSAAELAADLRAERGPALASPAAPPARTKRWPQAAALAAVALTVVAAGAALRPRVVQPAAARLAAVDVVDGALRGKDADGRVLWVHRFAVPLVDSAYAAPQSDTDGVRLRLRTSSAAPQAWVIAPDAPKGPGVLHAVSAEGRLLWKRPAGRVVHFGGERFDRFSANRLHALTDARGRRRLFLSVAHHRSFPGALEELGPDGRTVAEYWSPGHVTSVNRVPFAGRDALAVGGYHNETRGAGLALLDLDAPSGRMPAVADKFRCSDCGTRDPLAALVFPGSDALRELSAGQGAAQVIEVHETESGLSVTVLQARYRSEVDGRDVEAVVRYELDAEAHRVLGVVAGDGFLRLHEKLHATGEIDHPFGDADRRALARVRRWSGTGWSELASAFTVSPAKVDYADGRLRARDREGTVLWSAPLEQPPASRRHGEIELGAADLDEDGRNEAYVVSAGRLQVFEPDGRLRYGYQSDLAALAFGGREFRAPYRVALVQPAARGGLWVGSHHHTWFPSVLEQLDARGRRLSRYVSNGYIGDVAEATIGGRELIFVGATSNETRGASLAVFDRRHLAGSAPAEDATYACAGCLPGHPLAFVVFPRLDAARAITGDAGGSVGFQAIEFPNADEIKVLLVQIQPNRKDATLQFDAAATYLLDARTLAVREAWADGTYQNWHRLLHKQGHLDHDYGPQDEADLLAVRAWDGTRFVPLGDGVRYLER
jgi:hypothetical protein